MTEIGRLMVNGQRAPKDALLCLPSMRLLSRPRQSFESLEFLNLLELCSARNRPLFSNHPSYSISLVYLLLSRKALKSIHNGRARLHRYLLPRNHHQWRHRRSGSASSATPTPLPSSFRQDNRLQTILASSRLRGETATVCIVTYQDHIATLIRLFQVPLKQAGTGEPTRAGMSRAEKHRYKCKSPQ